MNKYFLCRVQNLLTTRLQYETPLSRGKSEDLLSRMSVLSSGCDFLSIELLRLRGLGQEGGVWVTQIKEMESFNNDLRQACRKVYLCVWGVCVCVLCVGVNGSFVGYGVTLIFQFSLKPALNLKTWLFLPDSPQGTCL